MSCMASCQQDSHCFKPVIGFTSMLTRMVTDDECVSLHSKCEQIHMRGTARKRKNLGCESSNLGFARHNFTF